jgi:hypothetical protein
MAQRPRVPDNPFGRRLLDIAHALVVKAALSWQY